MMDFINTIETFIILSESKLIFGLIVYSILLTICVKYLNKKISLLSKKLHKFNILFHKGKSIE